MPSPLYKFLASPAEPFTIFFWCANMKWYVTYTNVKDLKLPTTQISTKQQLVIGLTGFTWARYSLVIIPVNYLLCSANFFMGCSAAYQLSRKYTDGNFWE